MMLIRVRRNGEGAVCLSPAPGTVWSKGLPPPPGDRVCSDDLLVAFDEDEDEDGVAVVVEDGDVVKVV